jgi:hypothetical protein
MPSPCFRLNEIDTRLNEIDEIEGIAFGHRAVRQLDIERSRDASISTPLDVRKMIEDI